jgi:methylated-DNA-protein-cysteine methyltransferase-like protein
MTWNRLVVPAEQSQDHVIQKGTRLLAYEGTEMETEPSSVREQIAILKARVFALVRACPPGRVTTYGWLATCAGYTNAARIVGWIIHEAGPGIPAQRVINSKGELSGSWAFGTPERMRQLLEAEGVVFSDAGKVDLKRYGWDPSRHLSLAEIADICSRSDGAPEDPGPRLMNLVNRDPTSPFKQS